MRKVGYWVVKFTRFAMDLTTTDKTNTCGTWVADETVLLTDRGNIWFWDVIDEDSRFLLASHISTRRTTIDAQKLFLKAASHSKCMPHTVITDKLQAYQGAVESVLINAFHERSKSFSMYPNTNLIERFHGTLKDRTKVMRGLKSLDSSRFFTDGWLIHYNYCRPHMALLNRTPAEMAGVDSAFKNWKDIVKEY